ncbi:MAG: sulfatase family protein [Mycobacteriales bacterium]
MPDRPNIVFVMSDDHAAHAISAYASVVNQTPNIDRLARDGMRLDACFVTNSICAPSRASILTGTHTHINGVRTLGERIDASQPTFISLLHDAGYQTALFGKWHLGEGQAHEPQGFDAWEILPGQGKYHDPEFITAQGTHVRAGYATDIITDLSLDWLRGRDRDRPFCLLVHHKAPHRPWQPDKAHAHLYDDFDIPVPDTYDDDYEGRGTAAHVARMRVRRDLSPTDLKGDPPPGMSEEEHGAWCYQRYMKDYLRCIASVDDNMGRLLDRLDAEGIANDTIVVYTSDQGFFLGDHGWYDKRFMYDESLQMPFLVRYPREVSAGTTSDAMVTNVDFATTFLDYAGVEAIERMQGRSARPVLAGSTPADWPMSMYYRYWEHDDDPHHVWAHYGVRTHDYKLIYYYAAGLGIPGAGPTDFPPEWELFDLRTDPRELRSVYDDPAYAGVRAELTTELERLQRQFADVPRH